MTVFARTLTLFGLLVSIVAALPAAGLARPNPPSGPPSAELVLEQTAVALRGPNGTPQVRFAVYADGTWLRDGVSGRLEAEAVNALVRAVAAATFSSDPDQRAVCRAMPTRRLTLRGAGERHYSWVSPCGLRPHPSLVALVRQIEALTAGSLD